MSINPNITSAAISWDSKALIEALPLNEIVGLCRIAYNVPVRAYDVPTGIPEPPPEVVQDLVNHIGMAVIRGTYRPEVPEVMGAAEVATELGVKQQNIRTIKGIPRPIVRLRSGSLWDAGEIRLFAAARRKRRLEVRGV